MPRPAARRTFGELESRRSVTTKKVIGWRARYVGPDLERHSRQFADRVTAEAWLAAEQKLIDRDEWTSPRSREVVERPLTLAEWAEQHPSERDLAPSTRREYERVLRRHIEPSLGTKALRAITVRDVAQWHARLTMDLAKRAREDGRTNGDGRVRRPRRTRCCPCMRVLSRVLTGGKVHDEPDAGSVEIHLSREPLNRLDFICCERFFRVVQPIAQDFESDPVLARPHQVEKLVDRGSTYMRGKTAAELIEFDFKIHEGLQELDVR